MKNKTPFIRLFKATTPSSFDLRSQWDPGRTRSETVWYLTSVLPVSLSSANTRTSSYSSLRLKGNWVTQPTPTTALLCIYLFLQLMILLDNKIIPCVTTNKNSIMYTLRDFFFRRVGHSFICRKYNKLVQVLQ